MYSKLKAHLTCWLSLANINQGRSLILSQQTVTITTYASLTGWGGHMKNQRVAHPEPDIFRLTAWRLSTSVLKQKVFQKILRNCCQPPGDQVLGNVNVFKCKFRKFNCRCSERIIYPNTASIEHCVNFLGDLFEKRY